VVLLQRQRKPQSSTGGHNATDLLLFQRTLFFFCFCNELFFVCLYLNAFYSKPLISPDLSVSALILRGLSVASSPETAWKIATYFPKASNMLVWFIRQVTWPQVVAILTGPVCFGKNIINCVQFWKASKIVGRVASQDIVKY
jgi:CDP-diacylglycerol--inositol 3-phosphatidyltransferase